MVYISNSFSLQMVKLKYYYLDVLEVDHLPQGDGLISCIGHADTAKISNLPYNRVNLILEKGDVLYVAQLQGGRLPEGCTTLPEGFTFKYYRIEIL